MCFKIVKLTTIRNGPKRTISTCGGFRLLQMVLEPDTEQCTSVGGVDCEIPHRMERERNIPYKDVETSP